MTFKASKLSKMGAGFLRCPIYREHGCHVERHGVDIAICVAKTMTAGRNRACPGGPQVPIVAAAN